MFLFQVSALTPMLLFKTAWSILYASSVNVTVGEKEERMMITGMHTVVDIFCVGCGSIVGWKYVRFSFHLYLYFSLPTLWKLKLVSLQIRSWHLSNCFFIGHGLVLKAVYIRYTWLIKFIQLSDHFILLSCFKSSTLTLKVKCGLFYTFLNNRHLC